MGRRGSKKSESNGRRGNKQCTDIFDILIASKGKTKNKCRGREARKGGDRQQGERGEGSAASFSCGATKKKKKSIQIEKRECSPQKKSTGSI